MNLDRKELFRAIEKCLINAQELYEEALILKEHDKYARAYTLFQICIEEVGKTSLIYKFLLDNNMEESRIKKFLKDFTNHKTKIKSSIAFDKMLSTLIDENDKELKESYEKEILNQYNNIDGYNNYKNHSLYTSYHLENFCIPSELFSLENLNSINFISITRLNTAKNFFEIAKSKMEEFKNLTYD